MNVSRVLAGLLVATAVLLCRGSAARAEDPPHGKSESHASAAHGDAGHGGAQHDAEHGGSADPLSIDMDLAWWTFVIFLVLLAVLRKFAWGPIMAALEHREKVIAEHIAVAEQSEQAAKHLLAEYEAKLAKAQDEVRAIMDEARKHAERTHQEILAKARDDAKAEMDRAVREIETAKDQALISLSEASANSAVSLAGKILEWKMTPADQSAMVQRALAGFPEGGARRN